MDKVFASLKTRGLKGVRLFVSDKCLGLVESLADFYPQAKWQRCVVHFYRNVFTAGRTGNFVDAKKKFFYILPRKDCKTA
ncbi:MAG: hypothetical protein GX155_03585 [Smithella sp.]|nr:hypothetical protein [Smithella sp.]